MRRFFATMAIVAALPVFAQELSHHFEKVSLSEALVWIDQAQATYKINFLFDELEDFMVTETLRGADVKRAVRQVCEFYPMLITVDGDEIFVECYQKAATKLRGRVVDRDGLPLSFCNIALLSPADSTYLAGGVSNESGDFVIPCEAPEVVARFTYVGYERLFRRLPVDSVGTITMHPEAQTLGTVSVRGQRPQYQLGEEGMVANVEGTVLENLGTLTDVLGMLPNVLASDGGVQVLGKGKPLIYLNGRKVYDQSELVRIKSADVKSVEVIMTPGAKYDATVHSVIKVVMKKQQGDGFGGKFWTNLVQGAHHTGYILDADCNYRRGGLDLGALLYYSRQGAWVRQSGALNVFDCVEQRYDHVIRGVNNFQALRLSANYEFNEHHTAGLRWDYQLGKYTNAGGSTLNYEQTFADGATRLHTANKTAGERAMPNHTFNAYYSGQVGKLAIAFDADAVYKNIANASVSDVAYDGAYSHTVSSGHQMHVRFFATKLVLTCPIWKGTLDFGYEQSASRLRQRNSLTGTEEELTDDKICERIFAAFAQYNLKLGRWSAAAGLRYEHTASDYEQFGVRNDDLSRTYADAFPSATVAYGHGKFEGRLGFSLKTSRPGYAYLSNYKHYGSDYFYESGNSLLRPAFHNAFDLLMRYDWLTLSGSFTRINDCIVGWDERYGSSGAVLSKDVNIPHGEAIVLTIAGSKTVGPWTPNYSVSMLGTRRDYRQFGVTDRYFRPIWRLKLYNTFQLPWRLTLQANYTQQFSGYNDNCRSKANANVSLLISRPFLRDRLTVYVRWNDLFKTSAMDSRAAYSYSCINHHYYSDLRYVRVDLIYRFNMARSKYRGTGAGNAEKARF